MIIRTRKDNAYVSIRNATLRDGRLTWKARGLLAYLLSMPDNWETNVAHLAKQSPDGETSVRSGLKELEEAGYFRRERVYENGRIVRWESVVFETPTKLDVENLKVGVLELDEPVHKKDLVKEVPKEERPTTPVAAKADDVQAPPVDDLFDEFWSVYPRKTGKPSARKAFERALKKTDARIIIDGASRYRCDPNRVDQFTKHPGPWLNDERWEDGPLPSRTGLKTSSADRTRSNIDAVFDAMNDGKPGPFAVLDDPTITEVRSYGR